MTSLNEDFQSIDVGTNDTVQSQQFEPESAAPSRSGQSQPSQEQESSGSEQSETGQEGTEEANPDASAEVSPDGQPLAQQPPSPTNPNALPSLASQQAPQAPPTWMKDFIAETNKPANQLFEMLRQQQEANQQAAQQRAQVQRLESEKAARKAMRDATRPRPPDFNNTTAAEMGLYAQQLTEFESRCAREDATAEMQSHFARIEQRMQQQVEEQNQRAQAAESARIGTFIDQSMDRFKQDPTTKFMNNPQAQDLFLSRWWSANERAGQLVDPGVVMSQFKSELAAINGSAQTVQKRNEQDSIDKNRRNEQAGRGAPNQVRQGGAIPGPAKKEDPYDKPWWETGALRVSN